MNNKEYDYDFSTDVTSGDITPHRVTLFLPYTFHRLNRILEDYYGCKLEAVWQGYKANRKPGYKQHNKRAGVMFVIYEFLL